MTNAERQKKYRENREATFRVLVERVDALEGRVSLLEGKPASCPEKPVKSAPKKVEKITPPSAEGRVLPVAAGYCGKCGQLERYCRCEGT